MNRKYCYGLSLLFYLVCLVAVIGLVLNTFGLIALGGTVKNIGSVLFVLSGYFATFFLCLHSHRRARFYMKAFLLVLFLFYAAVLFDFTLLDEDFGRNILNIFDYDKHSFMEHIENRINLIPFATVTLFFKGYANDLLSLYSFLVNIFGNFLVLFPLPFFILIFRKRRTSFSEILIICLVVTLSVEVLQFLLLTGSTDIDDVLLNMAGAICFCVVSRIKRVGKGISKLTFGVWENYES